jgi:single-strand DNA-binding protein
MSFQINGKLVKKMEMESKTPSFQTREFVIVTQEQYPQHVKFQLVQDRCSIIDKFNENDELTVFFDLRGREWQGKYFTNLQAWKVEAASASGVLAGQDLVADREAPDPFSNASESFDDLPF